MNSVRKGGEVGEGAKVERGKEEGGSGMMVRCGRGGGMEGRWRSEGCEGVQG